MNFEDYNYNMYNQHILIDSHRNFIKDSSPDSKEISDDGSSK